MEKTVILIEELFDCYDCDRPAKRTLTYQGFTIINDDLSEIISEIKHQTISYMDSYNKTMEIEFFIPEEERPNNDDKYKIGLWKLDEQKALIRLKSGQKISTYSGNQYAFNFCVKPGMLTKDLFAISIPHL